MKKYAIRYLIALGTFLVVDAIWLGAIAKDFFLENLGPVVPLGLSIVPALIFYLIYGAAIVYFCVNPAIEKASFKTALLRGAFFGLMSYGAYDLTNQATIKNWPLIVVVVDMAWGTFLTAVVSAMTFTAGKRIVP